MSGAESLPSVSTSSLPPVIPESKTSSPHKTHHSLPADITNIIKDVGGAVAERTGHVTTLPKEHTSSTKKLTDKPDSLQKHQEPDSLSEEAEPLTQDPISLFEEEESIQETDSLSEEAEPPLDPPAHVEIDHSGRSSLIDEGILSWKEVEPRPSMGKRVSSFVSDIKHTVSHSEIKSEIANKLNNIGNFILTKSLDIMDLTQAKTKEMSQKAHEIKSKIDNKTDPYTTQINEKMDTFKEKVAEKSQALKETTAKNLESLKNNVKTKISELREKKTEKNPHGQLASPAFYTYLGEKVITALETTDQDKQGVFRLQANLTEQKQLAEIAKKAKDLDEYKQNESIKDSSPPALAGLYKTFFREMPSDLKNQIKEVAQGEIFSAQVLDGSISKEEGAKQFLENLNKAAAEHPEEAKAFKTLINALTFAYIKDWAAHDGSKPENLLVAVKFFTEYFYTPSTDKGMVGMNEDLDNEKSITPFLIEVLKQNAIAQYPPEQASVFK